MQKTVNKQWQSLILNATVRIRIYRIFRPDKHTLKTFDIVLKRPRVKLTYFSLQGCHKQGLSLSNVNMKFTTQ